MCGNLIHKFVWLARVQDAGKSAHLTVHPLLVLALLPSLLVPVVVHPCLPVYRRALRCDDHMVPPFPATHLCIQFCLRMRPQVQGIASLSEQTCRCM